MFELVTLVTNCINKGVQHPEKKELLRFYVASEADKVVEGEKVMYVYDVLLAQNNRVTSEKVHKFLSSVHRPVSGMI